MQTEGAQINCVHRLDGGMGVKRKAEIPAAMPAHQLDHAFVKELLEDFSAVHWDKAALKAMLEKEIVTAQVLEQLRNLVKTSPGIYKTSTAIFDELPYVKLTKDLGYF